MLNFWYRIIDWFCDNKERYGLIREFNKASKNAFIEGSASTLLEAKITTGDSTYRHEFSRLFGGGLESKLYRENHYLELR